MISQEGFKQNGKIMEENASIYFFLPWFPNLSSSTFQLNPNNSNFTRTRNQRREIRVQTGRYLQIVSKYQPPTSDTGEGLQNPMIGRRIRQMGSPERRIQPEHTPNSHIQLIYCIYIYSIIDSRDLIPYLIPRRGLTVQIVQTRGSSSSSAFINYYEKPFLFGGQARSNTRYVLLLFKISFFLLFWISHSETSQWFEVLALMAGF